VLIKGIEHHGCMFGLILIALIVVAAPLAYAIGVDSRLDDVARRRHFNG
jgi:hypothetical protein